MTIKEEFEQAARRTGLDDDVDAETTAAYIKNFVETVPHANEFSEYVSHAADKQLGRAYRKFNGIDFEDNDAAITKTKPMMKLAWLALVWQSLAAGVLVGQEDPRFVDPKSIYTDDFELAAVQYANEAASDEELMGLTSQSFEEMIGQVTEKTGFNSVMSHGGAIMVELGSDGEPKGVDPDTIKHLAWKVWDLWNMIFNAGANAYFATGYEIGKARHEEEVLSGIIEATEEGSDD